MPQQVLDMDKLITGTLEEERQKRMDAARESAIPDAILTVKMRLQEEQAAEQQALAAANVRMFYFTTVHIRSTIG